MTRGRKKDLTIPPTRALVQQRDYRARKANYISDLEERVRIAEAENAQLRKDLEAARSTHGTTPNPYNVQVSQASRELMQHLTLASSSLNRFQQLAFLDQDPPPILPPLQFPHEPQLRPASFPSPAPSSPYSQASLQPSFRTAVQAPLTQTPASSLSPTFLSYPAGRKRLYREDSPEPTESIRFPRTSPPYRDRSSSIESECCGGILDCQDLIEENDNRGEAFGRLSGLRSTSERSSQNDHSS